MYKIERRNSGYLLTFSGVFSAEEAQRWYDESEGLLTKETATTFSVIIDMRKLAPLQPEAQELMVKGQQLYRAKGMLRSAVLVHNDVTAMQFKRLAAESGILKWERYIAGTTPNCTQVAIAWAKDGVEPG